MSVTALANQTAPNAEEDVSQYLAMIRAYPRLTPEQERELARQSAQGSEEAIRTMVCANLRLVVSIAREGYPLGAPKASHRDGLALARYRTARTVSGIIDHSPDPHRKLFASEWCQ